MKKTMETVREANNDIPLKNRKLLNGSQIEMINEALTQIGDFGEIRLVVQGGKLRFIVTQQSIDVLKWKPGSLKKE